MSNRTVYPTNLATKSSAEICRQMDWPVGTVLESTKVYHGPIGQRTIEVQRIMITAVGEEAILARCVEFNGVDLDGEERVINLRCRDWQKVQ